MAKIVKNNLGNFLVICLIFVIVSAPILFLTNKQIATAAPDTGIIRLDGDTATIQWTPYGNNGCSGTQHWCLLNENVESPTAGETADYVGGTNSTNDQYTMGTITEAETITAIEIFVYGYVTKSGTLSTDIIYDGSTQHWLDVSLGTSYGWATASVTGLSLTQSQLASLEINIIGNQGGRDYYVATLYTKITYTPAGALTINTPASLTFGAVDYSFTGQNSTGNTFGTDSEPVRVDDGRGTGTGWTMVATCQDWTKGADNMDYDGDGVNTGQLIINQDSVTVTKVSGQDIDPTYGPKKGTTASFSASVTEITIGSADSGYGQGTYDFKNYDLQQFIPGMQDSGDYTTTLTVTVS